MSWSASSGHLDFWQRPKIWRPWGWPHVLLSRTLIVQAKPCVNLWLWDNSGSPSRLAYAMRLFAIFMWVHHAVSKQKFDVSVRLPVNVWANIVEPVLVRFDSQHGTNLPLNPCWICVLLSRSFLTASSGDYLAHSSFLLKPKVFARIIREELCSISVHILLYCVISDFKLLKKRSLELCTTYKKSSL